MQHTVTREIGLDMAHRIPQHGSKCRQLHGHRYTIQATVSAPQLHAVGEQEGMVIDFGFLKDIMMKCIHDVYDHGTALVDHDPLIDLLAGPLSEAPSQREILGLNNVQILTVVPTAENLAWVWGRAIADAMEFDHRAKDCTLENVTVWETPNCSVTCMGP